MQLDIKKLQRRELRNKIISVRTYQSYSKWLMENNISPSKLFNESIEQLMQERK